MERTYDMAASLVLKNLSAIEVSTIKFLSLPYFII
jgi:hypothetical protein